MVEAQKWLDKYYNSKHIKRIVYPNSIEEETKNEKEITIITKEFREELEGEELIIADYPQLEEIIIRWKEPSVAIFPFFWNRGEVEIGSVKKIIISNCSQLTKIIVRKINCQDFILQNIPKLQYLDISGNKLTEINLESQKELVHLNTENNPLVKPLLTFFDRKKVEELAIHQDAMKAMDNFYRQNPPNESLALQNILQSVSNDYLEINLENKRLKKENQELKKIIGYEKEFYKQEIGFLLKHRRELLNQKRKEFEQLTNNVKNELSESGKYLLEKILRKQKKMLQNKNYYFSRQKLEEIKLILSKELRNNKGKLLSLFAKQEEFFHLAIQWEEAEWLEEKVEIPPKAHN